MPKTQKSKNKIILAAAKVFYQNGYRATGMEAVAEAAGVTKATLYHHFDSKDELIEAAVRFLSEYHKENYQKAWSKAGLSPIDKLTVLFEDMGKAFRKAAFYGCPFINAAGEYTDKDSFVRQICEAHYQFLVQNLFVFAKEAGLRKPRIVAETITGLIAGAYTGWYVGGIEQSAKYGKDLALMIIEKHKDA